MAEFVLDASVGDPSEDTPYSRRILNELLVRDALVPDIWALEIANNIFVSHRKRRITEQQIAEYLDLLSALHSRRVSDALEECGSAVGRQAAGHCRLRCSLSRSRAS